ncbi:hypothetical protein A3Q56_03108 [Intoshia linei]|uniref:Uncharacterized protein n=1 Tax=Intoshia linei TaxID=1819745 RepID=A0A177B623_9BILA|nr:hypothetical protein A3Q56_03108 [Intoshia linei]
MLKDFKEIYKKFKTEEKLFECVKEKNKLTSPQKDILLSKVSNPLDQEVLENIFEY